ncbi:MAG TPA: sulfite exporter TauE/SafE family protein [Thermoanaerobaculia bacterium]|nr:sulfite exporter TauE/SafE family protein [Thermoanaerobaculia bacterium]
MPFSAVVAIVAFIAGAIASVAGFGIGSILTPLLGLRIGVKLAVAAVSIAHVTGTAVRFWTLRDRVDRQVLKTFGLMSAAGGLLGALLHNVASSPALRIIFAAILIFAGIMGVTGWSDRLRFGRAGASVAGGLSGFLGGLIGNQGGIRAAAMLAFDVPKEAFVATATAIALIVDGVRMPVYAISEGRALVAVWPLIAIATAGVVAGTLLGRAILGRIPEKPFRRIVAALILILGVAMLF